jgi:uncharacterized damage-inducible protein DinB
MPSAASPLRTTLWKALEFAHQVLEGTVADVDDELANRQPEGRANSVGSCYAHTILSEDYIVNVMLRGGKPLSETDWAGRTGASRPQPWTSPEDLGAWYHSVRVDMEAARRYAQEVYAKSSEFVDSLDDEDLTKEIEAFGMRMTVAMILEAFVTGHASSLAGEISAIKGTFGRKGYPW